MEAAYASHGDTKHVLPFPSTPKECFDMTADSFDLPKAANAGNYNDRFGFGHERPCNGAIGMGR